MLKLITRICCAFQAFEACHAFMGFTCHVLYWFDFPFSGVDVSISPLCLSRLMRLKGC